MARQRIQRGLQVLLHTHDSARRTSLAFAVGVFIGCLPPVPWFHTIAALAVAFVFRLNRVATVLGAYVNTPLTMLPLLAAQLSLGLVLLGGEKAPDLSWGQFGSRRGWMEALTELRPFLAPLLLGSVLLGAVVAVLAYALSVWIITAYRRRVARTVHEAQAELELVAPSVVPAGAAKTGAVPSGRGGESALDRPPGGQAAGAVDSASDRP